MLLEKSSVIPIPKKDKVASAKIAPAMPKATKIMTGPMALGRACLNKILPLLNPKSSRRLNKFHISNSQQFSSKKIGQYLSN